VNLVIAVNKLVHAIWRGNSPNVEAALVCRIVLPLNIPIL
jgi:hypothetical protein